MTFRMAVQSPSAGGLRGDAGQQRDPPTSVALHLGGAALESLKDAKTVQSPSSEEEEDPNGAGGKEQQKGVHDVEAPRGLHVALPPGGRMGGRKTEAREQGSCSPFRLGRRGGHPVLVPFWPKKKDPAGKQSPSSQGALSAPAAKSRAAGASAGSRGRRATAGNACNADRDPQKVPEGKQGGPGPSKADRGSLDQHTDSPTVSGCEDGPCTVTSIQYGVCGGKHADHSSPGGEGLMVAAVPAAADSAAMGGAESLKILRTSESPRGRESLGDEGAAAASPVESSAPEPQAQGATAVTPSPSYRDGLEEQGRRGEEERGVVEESSEQEGKEKEEGQKGLDEVLIQPHPPPHHEEEEEVDGAEKTKVLSEEKGEEQERDGAAGASETKAASASPSTQPSDAKGPEADKLKELTEPKGEGQERDDTVGAIAKTTASGSPSTQPSDTKGPEAEKPKELNEMHLSEGQERGGAVGTIAKKAASGSLGTTQPRDTKAPPFATTTTPTRSATARRHAHRRLRSCNARLDAAFDAGLLSSPLPERRHARSKSSRALSLSQGECHCTGTLSQEKPASLAGCPLQAARGSSTVPRNELAQCSARSRSSNALGVAAGVLAEETRQHESLPGDGTPVDSRDQRAGVGGERHEGRRPP